MILRSLEFLPSVVGWVFWDLGSGQITHGGPNAEVFFQLEDTSVLRGERTFPPPRASAYILVFLFKEFKWWIIIISISGSHGVWAAGLEAVASISWIRRHYIPNSSSYLWRIGVFVFYLSSKVYTIHSLKGTHKNSYERESFSVLGLQEKVYSKA